MDGTWKRKYLNKPHETKHVFGASTAGNISAVQVTNRVSKTRLPSFGNRSKKKGEEESVRLYYARFSSLVVSPFFSGGQKSRRGSMSRGETLVRAAVAVD